MDEPGKFVQMGSVKNGNCGLIRNPVWHETMLTEDCWAVVWERRETMKLLISQIPISKTFPAAHFGMLMGRFA